MDIADKVAELEDSGFPGLLARLMQTPATVNLAQFAADWKQADREEYEELLRTMDWQFEFIDDSRTRDRAKLKLDRIKELQPTVDPTRALFLAARPGNHGDCGVAA